MWENKDALYIKKMEDICFSKEPWSLDAVKSVLQREDVVYKLVYDETKAPIGYFIAAALFEEAELYRIGVIPEQRGMGYGKKLMNELLKNCPQKTEKIFLEVRESNTAAIRLYESYGFKATGRRKNYYGNESALNYMLKINNG